MLKKNAEFQLKKKKKHDSSFKEDSLEISNNCSVDSDNDCTNNDKENNDLDLANEDDEDERQNFDVVISQKLWRAIKLKNPLIYKGRKYPGFEPRVWSNIVSFAFWKQYHLKKCFCTQTS